MRAYFPTLPGSSWPVLDEDWVEGTAIGRCGSSLRLAGAVVLSHELDREGDMRATRHSSHNRYREHHALRTVRSAEYNLARALASARSLAELCGFSVSYGIPLS